jgi:hypothetical protein
MSQHVLDELRALFEDIVSSSKVNRDSGLAE